MGLKVMDIKTEFGPRVSWKMHRGNRYRSGSLDMTLLSYETNNKLIPKVFYLVLILIPY